MGRDGAVTGHTAADRAEKTSGKSSSALLRIGRTALGALLVLLGGFCALANLGLWNNFVVGVVVAAAGLILLLVRRLPWRVAGPVVALVMVVGTLAGTLRRDYYLCCMYGYNMWRGWPLVWLNRGADGDTEEQARRLALHQHWSAEPNRLTIAMMFWACAGLVVVGVVTLAARRWSVSRARPGDAAEPAAPVTTGLGLPARSDLAVPRRHQAGCARHRS
jgi:hypothetical protein